MPGPSTPHLVVDGVSHRFASGSGTPVEVLRDIDLTVERGMFVGLIGPSGCGKSTLLRIIAGLEAPGDGQVLVDGQPVRPGSGPVAHMPQQDLLLPWRRAIDNAILGAEVHGVARARARARARDHFTRFGLDGFEDAWPHELSGGMRQRLALLRTYLADRSLLLLDEPFGALDAITRRSMWAWLTDVLGGTDRSVLFVTHDVDEAIVLSDRVVVMSRRPGRLVASISVEGPAHRDADSVVEPWFNDHRSRILEALRGAHDA